MAKIELKQPIVQEIADTVKDAGAVVLVDYRGLTVEQDTALRRELREAGITYKVFKNTMMKRAFEGTPFAEMDSYLEGPSAIAVTGEDIMAPARIFFKTAKTVKALEMKCGVVEGVFYDAAGMTELAQIPARDVLLSRLLGSFQSPMANFARVIKQIAEKNGEAGASEEPAAAAAEEPAAEVSAAEAPAAEAPASEVPAAETAPEA